jgi:hypothetical protein
VGPVHQLLSRCPEHPFPLSLSLSAPWTLPVRSALPGPIVDRRVRTRARRRISRSRRPPTLPAPFLEPRQCPALAPTTFRAAMLSLALCPHCRRRRRPAPAFPTIQLAGDRAKPLRAPSRGETPLHVPNFPSFALCLANFGIVDALPWRSAVLARWPADLARSSSPE